MYTCEICCKIFTKKFNYMDHLKRKNPCKLVINPNNPNNPKMESTLNENIEINLQKEFITKENNTKR